MNWSKGYELCHSFLLRCWLKRRMGKEFAMMSCLFLEVPSNFLMLPSFSWVDKDIPWSVDRLSPLFLRWWENNSVFCKAICMERFNLQIWQHGNRSILSLRSIYIELKSKYNHQVSASLSWAIVHQRTIKGCLSFKNRCAFSKKFIHPLLDRFQRNIISFIDCIME